MPDFNFLCLILSSIDKKTILLVRFLELEKQVLKRQVSGRLSARDSEKMALALLFKEIGRPELANHETLFHPDTLQRWYRQLTAPKSDSSATRGRPPKREPLPTVVARLALENDWGYQTLSDELKLLGYKASPNTVKNILRRLGLKGPWRGNLPPWSQFIETHKHVLASCDFLSCEVPNGGTFDTYYVLFVLHLDTRQVHVAGMTQHPDAAWMTQVARNLTMDGGFLEGRKYLISDRDTKFCKKFRDILGHSGTEVIRLPWRSPNMNAYAERWVRTVKVQCLNKIILFNESVLRNALKEFETYYNHERPHQGLNGAIPMAKRTTSTEPPANAQLVRRSRLGGLFNYYDWEISEIAA